MISIRQCLRFSIFVCNQQYVFVAVAVAVCVCVCVLVPSGIVLVLVPALVFAVVLVDVFVANRWGHKKQCAGSSITPQV